MKNCIVAFLFLISVSAHGRSLVFEGIPPTLLEGVQNQIPNLRTPGANYADMDQAIRWLMQTGKFSNVEIIQLQDSDKVLLVGSVIRSIRSIQIVGNKVLTSSEILNDLGVAKGQAFERKNLLAASEDLRERYEQMGYLNAKIEISFGTPSETEITVLINIQEGAPCQIDEIVFETQNTELAEKLKKIAKPYVGKSKSIELQTDIEKKVNEFLTSNRYLSSRIGNPTINYNASRSRVKLIFILDNPMKFEIFVDGTTNYSESKIIRSLQLDQTPVSQTSPGPDLRERIRKFYLDEGYAHIAVKMEERSIPNLYKRQIRFAVQEGPRVKIRKIDIGGSFSRSTRFYLGIVKDLSSPLIRRGFFHRKDFEQGYKNLLIELQNQGYLKAKVSSFRYESSPDLSYVDISLQLEEGPLTQVKEVLFEGNKSISREHLLEQLGLSAGSALKLNDLESGLKKLRDYYRSQGFIEMRILNEEQELVKYNDGNTLATLEIKIDEGPKVSVAQIVLQGNGFTQDEVILRELSFKTGDTVTPETVEESVSRLQRLGLFSRVEIRTLEERTNLAERTVVITIWEEDPGEFLSGVGINNRQQITGRGYIGFGYRNLFGTARAVSSRLDLSYSFDPEISYLENKLVLGYLEPYIFGGRNRGRVNYTREQKFLEISVVDNSRQTIIQEENRVDFLIDRDLTRHLHLTYSAWSFSNQKLFARQNNEIKETQNVGKIGPLFELDYTDNKFNPSRGNFSFLSLEYSDPNLGSSDDDKRLINFFKTTASFTHYLPVANKNRPLWINNIRGGYLTNLRDHPRANVPPQESFFLGGQATLRGFGPSERIPSNMQLGITNLRDFRMRNENAYVLIKSEVRIPIADTPADFAFFYDGGAVFLSQADAYIDSPYRDSVGVGLRYNTPVGPVSLDFAMKTYRKVYTDRNDPTNRITEDPYAIYFSIGSF